MDHRDSRSASRAPHRAKPVTTSGRTEWVLEAARHLLDTATANRRA